MNLVKTYIDGSSIEGIGLFAAELIPKGTLIWRLIEPFDIILSKNDFEEQMKKLPIHLHDNYINRYLYEMNGKIVICGDDARFSNHSIFPNTKSTFDSQYAIMNIEKGDEILTNYKEINDNFDESEFDKLKSFK